MAHQDSSLIPVIDYEGSGYRTDFWEGRGREYEDAAERLALQELMPPVGIRIAEIGAGFGRLSDLYLGYEQVVLFDYSRTLLQDAVRTRGSDPKFVFVAGNIYALPLATGILDTLVMVRVMHHLANVNRALEQLNRTLHDQSVAVLEYANKRNLKALLRWVGRRQHWSPLAHEPVEFLELNYDFHPSWMDERFAQAGMHITKQYGVSHFRLSLLKERIPPQALARVDRALFGVGGRYPIAPSVFVQATAKKAGSCIEASTKPSSVGDLLRCPRCETDGLAMLDETTVQCPHCDQKFMRKRGVWDLKEPLT